MAGDGLRRPLNAPPGITPAAGVQPGTSTGIDFARVVIVFGPAGSISGVYVYPIGTTPGAGNPPIMSLGNASVDPYGNAIHPGISSQIPGGNWVSLFQGEIDFQGGSTITGTAGGNIVVTVASALAVEGGPILSETASGGTAANPTIITTDTWQTMNLLNGWTVGTGGYAQYKLEPNLKVSVRAANLAAGTLTAGTSLWTPPAAYAPTVTQRIPIVIENSTGAAVTETPRADVSAGGLAIENFPLNTTRIGFNHYYALD